MVVAENSSTTTLQIQVTDAAELRRNSIAIPTRNNLRSFVSKTMGGLDKQLETDLKEGVKAYSNAVTNEYTARLRSRGKKRQQPEETNFTEIRESDGINLEHSNLTAATLIKQSAVKKMKNYHGLEHIDQFFEEIDMFKGIHAKVDSIEKTAKRDLG
ncbi:hypothetical protein VTP01DRAFT_8757 [Rhizomucor pusillus]|uniref:uncharacterized protein n=1 Tax=Rhizomucor pusillus TaxID=4840 RepID=UPI003742D835